MSIARPRIALVGMISVAALAAPTTAHAHSLSALFESRLPLPVYLAGAATAVGLSFAFVLSNRVRAARPVIDPIASVPPAWLRSGLRGIGLAAWLWIAVQGLVGGGAADAEVTRLFLWVYGWVGLALVSAFIGPAWHWLDPFSTIHDLAAATLRRLGVGGGSAAPYPARLGRWPAVAGFAALVWLELVASGGGSRTLSILVLGYTAYTLAMMAQFGRDEWRANGEIFSVWFRLLGRLARYTLADDGARIRRRPFLSGLLEPGWRVADIVLVALATGSILFDGLSQTAIWVATFGLPPALPQTMLLATFLGLVIALALGVARLMGLAATGAGLLPIAVGYLLGHYLTYLLVEGQRIVVALSDPLQLGWDLFGTAFFEPSADWLPPTLVWIAQFAAVVGGHMIGAWAGHVVAAWRLDARGERELRRRQVPLAIVMVFLTTLTLWSLGQAIFKPPAS